jgi:hypothetical protein
MDMARYDQHDYVSYSYASFAIGNGVVGEQCTQLLNESNTAFGKLGKGVWQNKHEYSR